MDRNSLWLRDYNRRALVNALLDVYPAPDSPAAREEAVVIKRGKKIYSAKCLSCHPGEPTLDRSRSRKGWENIITRHEYWHAKWSVPSRNKAKLFKNDKDKNKLLEYLILIAGSEASLPAGPKGDPETQFQNLCFRCHCTTLRTYDWSKADKRFLERHISNKFDANTKPQAAQVMDFLLGDKGERAVFSAGQ